MACSSESRKFELKQVCHAIKENYDNTIHSGILLCEGEVTSVDVKLYSNVYGYLLVIPVGGCTDVMKLLPSIRKRNEDICAFGLIDRDSNSKKEIQLLKDKGIYCTKLPFIENIICSPEVIKILCKHLNLDYESIIKKINELVLNALSNKIKDSLPVNVSISHDDVIESITITIHKKNGIEVEKTVNNASILYAYRDKSIANIVSDAMALHGRKEYYIFISEMLEQEKISNKLQRACQAYLPEIKI